jgi:hypothetical protein
VPPVGTGSDRPRLVTTAPPRDDRASDRTIDRVKPFPASRVRVVAVAAVLQLGAGLVAAAVVTEPSDVPTAVATRARPAPPVDPSAPVVGAWSSAGSQRAEEVLRGAAVQRLLDARTSAVLGRDRGAFLATVDPTAEALVARQAALFDAVAEVPLARFDYDVEPLSGRPADPVLDERYGRGKWWAPDVVLRHALEGFDEHPDRDEQHLTFVHRDGAWLLGADDDFDAVGGRTQRAIWDGGPVQVARAPGVLVLGHADGALLRQVAETTAAAIPRVSAVWGDGWPQQAVVLVPSTTAEMSSLLGAESDLSRIAAVASAEPGDGDAVIDRVIVNPQNFGSLGDLGRRIVLTHEVTHLAVRPATGPAVPVWLAEGFADYVAYNGVDVSLRVAASDLRAEVQAGVIPAALPADDAFAGANPTLASAYQQAWLAVRLLVEQYGEPAVLAAYRGLGAAPVGDRSAALAAELQEAFGIDPARLTADWQASLQRQLG